MNSQRLEQVLAQMKELNIPQLVISDPSSIFYLTGKWFEPGERFLALYLKLDGGHKIFINKLFTAQEDLGVLKVWFNDTEDGPGLLADMADHNQVMGIDKNMPSCFLLHLMELKAAASYTNGSACVDLVRGCKDEEEIKFMKAVSQINDRAMEQFKNMIREGITEKALAKKMEDVYLALGADGYSFSPLVGFGANAAIGHYEPGDTVLKAGDCVLIDVGCKKDNYNADMTRTFFFDHVSEEDKKVYETVKAANETAEAMIRPGVRLCDIDKAARDVIEEAGYGKFFTHRLGHFIGIDVHDQGDVSIANENVAKEGMIFSIEPGIYLPNQVGVRIEDLVLVTKDGVERLNFYSKELTII